MDVLFLATFLAAAAPPSPEAFAGLAWQPLGEPGPGGPVGAIAQSPHDPKVLIAGGSEGGVWRTDDGGLAWRPSETPLPLGIQAFLFHPKDPQRIMAGTLAGAFVSADGGRSWNAAQGGAFPEEARIFTAPIAALAFVSGTDNAVLAGTGTTGSISTARNLGLVCRSDDFGATWQVFETRMGSVRGLACAPHAPSHAVMGTARGLFYSQSGGANWAQSLSGVPANGVWSVAALPGPGPRFAAALENAGVFVSHDGGKSWVSFDDALPRGTRALAWLAFDEGVLCAGLAREGNGVFSRPLGTAPWSAFEALAKCPAPYPDAIATRGLAAGAGLLAWTDRNAFFLPGQGTTWQAFAAAAGEAWRGSGFSLLDARAVACSPHARGDYMLIGARDFWLTHDGGSSFTASRRGLPVGFTLAGAVYSRRDAREILAWARNGDGRHAVVVSKDGGTQWRELFTLQAQRLYDLLPGVENPREFLALTRDSVLRTVSAAASWEPVLFLPRDGEGAFSTPADGRILLVWNGAEGGVWQSDDGGRVWLRIGTALPDARGGACVSPDGALFVAAGNAVWRRAADGWTSLRNFSLPARDLALVGDRTLVAICARPRGALPADAGEVWASPDLGATWQPLRRGLSGTAPALLATHPRDPELLLIGQRDGGFYRLTGIGAK